MTSFINNEWKDITSFIGLPLFPYLILLSIIDDINSLTSSKIIHILKGDYTS